MTTEEPFVFTPDELGQIAVGMKTEEEIMASRAANPAPEPTPNPTPNPEPTPDPNPDPEPTPDPNPTPDPEPSPAFDFTKFGANSEEELIALIQKGRTFDEKQQEIELFNQFKGQLEKPFKNDFSAKLDSFVTATGLDHKTAISILELDVNTLNPIEVLALNDILDDPAMVKQGLTKEVLMKIHADKLGYDPTSDDEVPPTVKYEAMKALKNVENKLKQFEPNTANIWENLSKEKMANQTKLAENRSQWESAFEKSVGQMKHFNTTARGEKLSIAVSSNEISELREQVLSNFSHLPAAEAEKAINQYVQASLELSKKDAILEAYEAKIAGKFKQEAKREQHNGQPVITKDKPDANQPVKSDYEVQLAAQFAKMGRTLPDMNLNR